MAGELNVMHYQVFLGIHGNKDTPVINMKLFYFTSQWSLLCVFFLLQLLACFYHTEPCHTVALTTYMCR